MFEDLSISSKEIADGNNYDFDESWGRVIHQVLELLIQSKVALLTKADPASFNDPHDKVLTSKDQDQKIILRYSNGILAPYDSSGDKEVHIAISIQSLYTIIFKKVFVPWMQKKDKLTNKIYLVAKVGKFVVGIVVKMSSVNKLVEHQKHQIKDVKMSSVNKLVEPQQTKEKLVFRKEVINTPIYQKYGKYPRAYTTETEMLWKLFVKLFDYEKAHFGITYKSLADDIGQLGFNITRQTLSNFYRHVSAPQSGTRKAIWAWINCVIKGYVTNRVL
ncbi:unnamed protein product [Rhizophagus irregularis]|uniref:Uncharacterized protein n=1 Tax=Rhizophagus irregularis TaxID=588596 RepID=A0A915ZML1_9GLOM|nr:unnamed protein product [Rhizophagus irregularis]